MLEKLCQIFIFCHFFKSHTLFDRHLHTIIVGVTVWHLGSPNYILVSSPCFPYLFPVTFVSYYCLFSSLHIVLYSPLLHVLTCEIFA